MHSNPGSLVTVRALAPLVMLVTGIVTILQGSLSEAGLFPAILFGLGVPTLGTTAVAWMLARQRYVGAGLAVLGWAAAHLVVAFVVTLFQDRAGDDIYALGAVASVITFVLAIPGWGVCAWFSRRRELDAGDTLLGWAAVWFGALQCLYIGVLGESAAARSAWLVLGACVIVLGVAIGRGVSRRVFTARAARGEHAAWRVRQPSIDELAHLPPLFALNASPAVLEMIRFASPSSAYRSEEVGEPFALVPRPAS